MAVAFQTRAPRVGLALARGVLGLAFALSVAGVTPTAAQANHHENPCANPCAGKNPCAGRNPCAGKNPCANPCGGGASVDPKRFKQPAGFSLGGGDVALGKQLWNDTSLSTNGAACATCHTAGAQFQPSFATPYPHRVAMVKRLSGVAEVNAAEMVQFCMLQPMQAEAFDWNDKQDARKLAALAAYVEQVQKAWKPNPRAANPCAANPCGPRR